jgi:hypothetical protein
MCDENFKTYIPPFIVQVEKDLLFTEAEDSITKNIAEW